MNVVPGVIESDDEFPSASIKSVNEKRRETMRNRAEHTDKSHVKNLNSIFNDFTMKASTSKNSARTIENLGVSTRVTHVKCMHFEQQVTITI